jgi:hypothetical protein
MLHTISGYESWVDVTHHHFDRAERARSLGSNPNCI